MVIYFFCAQAKGLHFDGTIQRDGRVKSHEEYNEIKDELKAQISLSSGAPVDGINIMAFNPL